MARSPLSSLRRWWAVRRARGTPVVTRFAVRSAPTVDGGLVELAWSVAGAGWVEIHPGLGEVPSSGRLRTRADADVREYTLVAHGRGAVVSASAALVHLGAFRAELGSAPSPVEMQPDLRMPMLARIAGASARFAAAAGPSVRRAPRASRTQPDGLRRRPLLPLPPSTDEA